MKGANTKKRVIEELRKTPIVEVACAKAGVGRTAFYDWKKKDPKFAAAVELAMMDGKDFVSDIAEGQLLNAIKSGDYKAVALWLRTHRAEYGDKLRLEGRIESDVSMTPEQISLAEEIIALDELPELADGNPNDHAEPQTSVAQSDGSPVEGSGSAPHGGAA